MESNRQNNDYTVYGGGSFVGSEKYYSMSEDALKNVGCLGLLYLAVMGALFVPLVIIETELEVAYQKLKDSFPKN